MLRFAARHGIGRRHAAVTSPCWTTRRWQVRRVLLGRSASPRNRPRSPPSPMTLIRLPRIAALLSIAIGTAAAQNPHRVSVANWTLSNAFDSATMRRVTYSQSVTPNWINGGDSLWYSLRDPAGCDFFLVHPR